MLEEHACGVDEQPWGAQVGRHGIAQGVDGLLAAQVAGIAARAGHLGRRALGRFGGEVGAGDAEALAAEARGDRRADAATRTGDDRDPRAAHSCSRMARVIAISATQVRYSRSGSSSVSRRLRGPVRSTFGSQVPSSA